MPSEKKRKMSLTISGDALMAFRGNSGFFTEFGDIATPAIYNNTNDVFKLHLTLGQVNSILDAISDIFSGPKYNKKTGREYNGLLELQAQIVVEKQRQFVQLSRN